MRSLIFAALLAALSLSTGADAQVTAPQAAVLRLRFQPQSAARYTARSLQRATVRGRDLRTETRVGFTLSTGALLADGDAERSLRFSEATLSAAGLAPALRARVMRGLRSAEIRYRQSDRGEVRARTLAGAASPDTVALLDALVQSFDAYLPVLPEGAARVGDRWSARRELTASPVAGERVNLRCELEFTLRELRRDGAAVLGVRATLTAAAGAVVAGVPFQGEGTAEGEATLDLRAGLLRESRVRGEFVSRLTVRGQELRLPSRFEDELHLVGARASASR